MGSIFRKRRRRRRRRRGRRRRRKRRRRRRKRMRRVGSGILDEVEEFSPMGHHPSRRTLSAIVYRGKLAENGLWGFVKGGGLNSEVSEKERERERERDV